MKTGIRWLADRIIRLLRIRHKETKVDDAPIFDQGFIDQLPPLGTYSIPAVVMLCRYLHPYRGRVERWFKNLPPEAKADMRARLRRIEDRTHLPARDELELHEYLLQKGLQPSRNPSLSGLTPDYSITLSNKQLAYVELATIFEAVDSSLGQQSVATFSDKLGTLELPYVLILQVNTWPANQLSYGKISRKVASLLQTASGQDLAIDLREHGLDGFIRAKYSPESNQVAVCLNGPVICGLPSLGQMHKAIRTKSNKYKNLDAPFIVGICTTDVFPFNQQSLENVLFGTEMVQVDFATGEQTPVRRRDGLIAPKSADNDALNTRISAVLLCECERQDNDLIKTRKLVHNPWAKHPLSIDVFSELPQLLPTGAPTGNSVTVEWRLPTETVALPL
jgi:hypothetical protein